MTTPAYEGQGDTADRGLLPDGRRLWLFSQSALKTVDICPERGRRTLLNLMPRYNTDSTSLGHAVHEVIEMCLQDIIDSQGPWALDDMISVACDLFDQEMAEPDAQWVKDKTAPTVHRKIARCLSTWHDDVLPSLDPLAVEVTFGPLTFHEDEERVIQVQGQIDYIDRVAGLADWKTTSRAWEPWEHQRWDIQPTLYTWGVVEMSMQRSAAVFDTQGRWTWHVLNINGDYQRIETTRGPNDWDWLKRRAATLAKMLEAELPEWHRNDSSALCSPRWCGAFADCKGQSVGLDWPQQR